jgi:PPP family 3-phenylpropionic acid transporter
MSPAIGFSCLFAAQFAAFGMMMPFFPAILSSHGLTAIQISIILATGSAVRLFAAPIIGRGADGKNRQKHILALGAAISACIVTGYAWGKQQHTCDLTEPDHSLI